jgi:hypothetical protein
MIMCEQPEIRVINIAKIEIALKSLSINILLDKEFSIITQACYH